MIRGQLQAIASLPSCRFERIDSQRVTTIAAHMGRAAAFTDQAIREDLSLSRRHSGTWMGASCQSGTFRWLALARLP